jgi:hypothetical protein
MKDRPLFYTVTGPDFRRSILWARGWVNPVNQAVAEKINELKRTK